MAAVGAYNYQTARQITITTTGNIDDLDLEGASVLIMNNASLATLRGFAAGYHGQEVAVVSTGAGQVDLAHQNTGSLAGSRLINYATSANSSLAAGIGTATYKYDGDASRWRLVSFDQGDWIAPAFNAAIFTADTGTWTVAAGDVLTTFAYWLQDKTLTVRGAWIFTSLSATPTNLFIAIPAGFTAPDRMDILGFATNNSASVGEVVEVYISSSSIAIARLAAGIWSASTDNSHLIFVFPFRVN